MINSKIINPKIICHKINRIVNHHKMHPIINNPNNNIHRINKNKSKITRNKINKIANKMDKNK